MDQPRRSGSWTCSWCTLAGWASHCMRGGWEVVRMGGCEGGKLWGWEVVRMGGYEGGRLWGWEVVRVRSCEDERLWRWEVVRVGGYEDGRLWGWEVVRVGSCEGGSDGKVVLPLVIFHTTVTYIIFWTFWSGFKLDSFLAIPEKQKLKMI